MIFNEGTLNLRVARAPSPAKNRRFGSGPGAFKTRSQSFSGTGEQLIFVYRVHIARELRACTEPCLAQKYTGRSPWLVRISE